ncbi:hypothetical protein D7Y27_28025 [Corallococcus sp. AB004]|uniref:cytochrome c oxidase assembly factor Coa1 family protein n=1 Tax=Corallococcus exiguus TaxID=83462 RepID=UPI000EA2919C|nr:cytochrome c oxidase assembly factor Coa1 family protein [Corallococcus exiguus]RKI36568.1 hypothetical protein D7Y27_28025 [Corallococcus sp. AB004]
MDKLKGRSTDIAHWEGHTACPGAARNKDGQANMTINLSGSRQGGRLEVKAVRTDDVWGFSRLRVVADNGEAVDVGGYSRH